MSKGGVESGAHCLRNIPQMRQVFPHEPNAKAFLREREDTTAPHGRAHASVQFLGQVGVKVVKLIL